jgi:hypothetical protein
MRAHWGALAFIASDNDNYRKELRKDPFSPSQSECRSSQRHLQFAELEVYSDPSRQSATWYGFAPYQP